MRPNMIFIMADDLGYGDLSGFGGNPTSETPNLDRLVLEGKRFVDMYSASPVCSPSRSSFMTGRFMTRTGVWPGVFSPMSIGGLALNETTLPEQLRDKAGYDTFMAGKWHLGVGEGGKFLPAMRGFQHYHGVPYGIDMCAQETVRDASGMGSCFAPNVSCSATQFEGGHKNGGGREFEVPCPYYVNNTIFEQPTNLLDLDDKYVQSTVAFIQSHRKDGGAHKEPFFVYFASHHTHAPAFAKRNFTNTSIRGWFGDHLRTLDWSVGEIMNAVDDAGLKENTLIFFSADNGPSLHWEDLGGTNGAMRCGKGTTWEGGQRVPSIARWPGTVSASSTSRDITTSMDFFATALELAGISLPSDRTYDSISMVPILRGTKGVRGTFYYWGKDPNPAVGLHAVRHGPWKMHWVTEGSHCENDYPDKECPQSRGLRKLAAQDYLLYNLDISPGETRNLSVAGYPVVVALLTELKKQHEAQPDIFGPSQIHLGKNNSLEPCAASALALGCDAAQAKKTGWPLCCKTSSEPDWGSLLESLEIPHEASASIV